MYRNGIRLDVSRLDIDDTVSERYAVFGSSGGFIGTAVIMRDEDLLKVEKNFL